ncbi:MAG: hypothetical protein JWM72_144 [Actinomycetia bacterium]|nr:hypothetical protein [Actinomycetes bacterium]
MRRRTPRRGLDAGESDAGQDWDQDWGIEVADTIWSRMD